MISGPAMEKNEAEVSLATAFASSVLPVPGGPWSRTPCGGSMPSFLKICGCFIGSSTISRTRWISFCSPPMSS